MAFSSPASGKRTVKHAVLINAAVAVSAVLVYQGLRSFIGPSLRNIKFQIPATLPSPAERRSEIAERASTTFIWDKVDLSAELQWSDCYGDFKCALLETPLDYWNGTEGTAALAVAMLPAKVPITDPRYGGPLLINPGGPGASGTYFVVATGVSLQRTVDTPGKPSLTKDNGDARYYDIVGLDPRGVGHSRPTASCFLTEMERAQWQLRQKAAGIPGSSNNAIADTWARLKAYGEACHKLSESKDRADNIFPFITTASTARDMLTFVDRYAEWREIEMERTPRAKSMKRLRSTRDKEKVQYWGFSYGSFLGQSFASMFPERTGRMVLDGIVDADDYIYASWTNNILDAEKTLDWFYSSCANAGPEACTLAKPGSTADNVRMRVDAILHHLYRHPVLSTGKLPDLITWSDVKVDIAEVLYFANHYAVLANLLTALEGVQSSSLVARDSRFSYPVCGKIPPEPLPLDAQAGISCGDAYLKHYDNFTLKDAHDHYERLKEISPAMAGRWTSIGLTCAAWQGRAQYSFRGPFGASAESGVVPILFIGNTADPVTPLRAAHKTSERFYGARVLTQDCPGHTSLSTASACTIRNVRTYIQTGKLPREGLVCQPDEAPFEKPDPDPQSTDALDDPNVSAEVEDAALISAHRNIRHFFFRTGLGLGHEMAAS